MIVAATSKRKNVSRVESLKSVELELRFRVANKIWVDGTMLPSRRALAKELGVDLHTVQRAIKPLLIDGTLTAAYGRGTFVTSRTNSVEAFDQKYLRSAGSTLPRVTVGRTPVNRTPALAPLGPGSLGLIAAYDPSSVDPEDISGIGSQEILRSLERTFHDAGGNTVTFNLLRPDGSLVSVQNAIEILIDRGVQSLAVIGIDRDPLMTDFRIPEWLSTTIPVVHISGQRDFQSGVHVYYDNRQAGAQAADHLLSIGCRRIVFLAPFFAPWLNDRIEGARTALKRSRLDCAKLFIHPVSHPFVKWSKRLSVEINNTIEESLELIQLADGVLAPNDLIAHQVIRAAAKRGMSVGTDFALVGFDDVPSSSFEGLTSLRPPFQELGREASMVILRLLTGENLNLKLCLPSHLVVRNSTRTYCSKSNQARGPVT